MVNKRTVPQIALALALAMLGVFAEARAQTGSSSCLASVSTAWICIWCDIIC